MGACSLWWYEVPIGACASPLGKKSQINCMGEEFDYSFYVCPYMVAFINLGGHLSHFKSNRKCSLNCTNRTIHLYSYYHIRLIKVKAVN